MLRYLALLWAGVALTSCASTSVAPRSTADIYADMQAREAAKLSSNVTAFPEDLAAKGIRRCGISNLNAVLASKSTGGGWRLHVSEDTYPGTKVYFLVDGQRYVGDENTGVAIPSPLMASLRAEKPVTVNYTDWPYGGDHQEVVTLTGFAREADRCEQFLAKKAGIEIFTP